jgi:hypothetical protein
VAVNKLETVTSSNLVPPAMASGSYQSSLDPNDLFSDDDEYVMLNNVAEMTPTQSDRAAHFVTAACLYPNLPPEALHQQQPGFPSETPGCSGQL